MKKTSLLLFCFSLCILANAQFSWVKQWDRRYGGVDGDYAIAFEKTIDGGFIIAGKTSSDSTGNKTTNMFGGAFDYWVIKVDGGGNLDWEKNFRGSDNDALWGLCTTSDGGYMIGGTSDSPIGGDKSEASRGGTDYWVIKLDNLGNKMWDKTFGGADDEDLSSIIQTADGGYLIGGESRSGISGDKSEAKFGINDYWVVKTNSLGVKQWDKVYGGPGYEQYKVSVQMPDFGYIHSGQSSSGVGGNKTDVSQGGVDYWLVKTDSLGVIQWDSAYGGSGDDNFSTMIKTSNGEIICGGWSTSGVSGDKTQPSYGQYDLWILKLTAAGAIQWDKDIGGTGIEDEFCSIYESPDGSFLLGATSYSAIGGDKTETNLGVEQPWVIKIDAVGNKLWDKTIFTLGHNESGLIKELTKGKCYVLVTSDNGLTGGDKSEDAWGGFSSDYWIVKYCEEETTGENELLSDNDVIVYPNPFFDELKVKLRTSNNLNADAILYDVLGNTVLIKKFNNETALETSELSKGIYILEVNSEGRSYREKIIK